MGNVTEIKDRTPNQEMVEQLEKMLQLAKGGEIRCYFALYGWADDSFTCGYSPDSRNSQLKFLGEISLMQHRLLTAYELKDEDSPLSKAIWPYE